MWGKNIMKIKKVITIVLSMALLLVSLTSCKIERISSESEPSAQELMEKFISHSKSKYNFNDGNGFDLAYWIKTILENEKKTTSIIDVDFDVPFEFQSADGRDNVNGKIKLSSNVKLLSIGKSNNLKLSQHNLYKIVCDYKFSMGGSFAPMAFSFDGNILCYLAVADKGDTIYTFVKLNDFDNNWYSYKLTGVSEGLMRIKEMESEAQKVRESVTGSNDSADVEKLVNHYYQQMIDNARITNKGVSVEGLNVNDAYEIKWDVDIFDDYIIDYIRKTLTTLDEDEFDKLGLDKLKNKLIIHEYAYFVKGEKSANYVDGYSIVKDGMDLTDIKIDFSNEYVNFKLNFDKGNISEISYNGSENDSISNDIIEKAIIMGENNLEDLLGAYGIKL